MKMMLWIVVIAVIGGTAAVWAIGPLRGSDGPLELLAFGVSGRFGSDVRLDADSSSPVLRFPLILGVSNGGSDAIAIDSVRLSLPARYRLVDASGRPIDGFREDGGPLARYTFGGSDEAIEPGTLPSVVPGADALFIEPLFAGLECVLRADGTPSLVPAPPYAPASLARIDAFWSLEPRSGRRHTGVLRLVLDDATIARRTAARSLNAGAVTILPDSARLAPDTIALEGSTELPCGEPGFTDMITSTSWWTSGNGRMIEVSAGERPGLRLYDRDADGVIEMEMQDTDGDGRFESSRSVRYPIPPFLLPGVAAPPPAPRAPDTLVADTASADSAVQRTRRDTTGTSRGTEP
ncbi:MAG: hypothetical protein L0271_11460 [Gemmatimonadetes bacterium]|nr:hypothetical protein [Gemmatimonadota bacterium]